MEPYADRTVLEKIRAPVSIKKENLKQKSKKNWLTLSQLTMMQLYQKKPNLKLLKL